VNSNNENLELTEMQKDTLGEIGNICMSSAATALHDILNKKVIITAPKVSITTTAELAKQFIIPYVIVDVSYTKGISGNNMLIVETEDVKLITSIMLDKENADFESELSELDLSAIGEAMNQMMGASSTAMSTLIAKPVTISPPEVDVVSISEDMLRLNLKDDPIIITVFTLQIENELNTEIILLMPFNFGKNLVNGFLEAAEIKNESEKSTEEQPTKEKSTASKTSGNAKEAADNNPPKQTKTKPGSVQNATFQSFDGSNGVKNGVDNIELLMDVPLQLTVELGRTKKYLKDILELNIGSIVSLEKPAGDLIDVLVNGKLLAKGEVVVIDDNFGIRITDIVTNIKKI